MYAFSVVVNLGSESNFSMTLFDLEKEISPLQKMNKCPKDFKRTSVERFFRANGFNLDWCSFKLVCTLILYITYRLYLSCTFIDYKYIIIDLVFIIYFQHVYQVQITILDIS